MGTMSPSHPRRRGSLDLGGWSDWACLGDMSSGNLEGPSREALGSIWAQRQLDSERKAGVHVPAPFNSCAGRWGWSGAHRLQGKGASRAVLGALRVGPQVLGLQQL